MMYVNDDLTLRALEPTHDRPWEASPAPGVWRKKLDRHGEESGRATTIVRYEAGASFAEHNHDAGEEFFVLEGTFSDQSGNFSEGYYVRNPAGYRHAPFSADGCTIFVKLCQFDDRDTERKIINTQTAQWHPGLVSGLSVLPLHEFDVEHIALVRWEPGTYFQRHGHYGGEEILVLEGVFEDEHGRYPAGTWIRNPSGSVHQPFSKEGCLIYVKTGHLPIHS